MAEMNINEFGKWLANKKTTSTMDITLSIRQVVTKENHKEYSEITIRNDKAKMFRSGRISVMTFLDYLLIKDDEDGYKLTQNSANSYVTKIADQSLLKFFRERKGHYNLQYSSEHGLWYVNTTRIEQIRPQ